MYPQSMFSSKKIIKKYITFNLKMINIFTAVNYCCILHGRVFVMSLIYLPYFALECQLCHIL